VAFGGRDGNGIGAVFTQAGKVVAEGETLIDGTKLAAFRGQGEVGISAGQLGDLVAFHGSVEIASDLLNVQVRAVFKSVGLETLVVAREDSDLPDGTPLDNITESGGVAISDSGEVAFHGDAIVPDAGGDSVKAVLTQAGLIAKEGDFVDGTTTLDEIEVTGGVAINPYGSEVAFHGKVGTTDAVFVGSAPPPTENIPPEADFSFTTDDLTANFEDLIPNPSSPTTWPT